MDKRVAKLLSFPEKLDGEVHLRLPKPMKWEMALVALAQGGDLSDAFRSFMEKGIAAFKKTNRPAYDAQVKKWGAYEAPTHKRGRQA